MLLLSGGRLLTPWQPRGLGQCGEDQALGLLHAFNDFTVQLYRTLATGVMTSALDSPEQKISGMHLGK